MKDTSLATKISFAIQNIKYVFGAKSIFISILDIGQIPSIQIGIKVWIDIMIFCVLLIHETIYVVCSFLLLWILFSLRPTIQICLSVTTYSYYMYIGLNHNQRIK